jgi:hypothetical protein
MVLAGARAIRRHSWEKKKNSFSFWMGPPRV